MATEEDWKKLSKALDGFYNRIDAEPFREPVDWKGLGLVDYPQLIAQPMDLGTIKNKLKKREYTVPMELHKDVTLVWTNCMTYNQDGSDFYKLAASLKKKWDDRFNKLQKELSVQGDAKVDGAAAAATTTTTGGGGSAKTSSAGGGSKASLADRRGFAKALYQISKEDLGKVLVEIEQKFPGALKRNSSEDEVELNVDALPGPLLSELTQFVNNAKKRKTGGGSKKAKTSKS